MCMTANYLAEPDATIRLVTMPLVVSFVMRLLRHHPYDKGQQFLERLKARCLVGDQMLYSPFEVALLYPRFHMELHDKRASGR
jgi:hypothetical protein